MKKLIILFVSLFAINNAMAQGCLPEGITFSSQGQINYFQTNYPGCTEIEGSVIISDNGSGDIGNLGGLSVLTSIGGSLQISGNNNLYSLTGLDNIDSIGGSLSISGINSPYLTSLAGLEGLTTIGENLNISSNYHLTSLEGLEGLTSIGGDLTITQNAIYSLSGLDNIEASSIMNLTIMDNAYLSDCEIQSICNYLANPNGTVNIGWNATGCNSVVELANACGGSLPCLPDGKYYFLSQDDIDNFPNIFPGCTQLAGEVWISGNNITNLNGLSGVTSISGPLTIFACDALNNLDGLNSLTTIENDFSITDNNSLTNFTGLDNLSYIGGSFKIDRNSSLSECSGLNKLATIGGDFHIGNYDTYLNGGNASLASLTGLEALTEIEGGLEIFNNPSLASIEGLQGLGSVGSYLSLSQNTTLSNLSGLGSLTSISGNLSVFNNAALTSLSGLENIAVGSITNLSIHDNNSLSSCEVQSICNYLASPAGTIQIHNNAPGCNSPEEVEAACLTTVDEIITGNGITIIPNPANDKITISSSVMNGNTQLSIFNVNGSKVIEMQLNDNETQIDISTLPRGVYFVRLQNEKMVETERIVKE